MDDRVGTTDVAPVWWTPQYYPKVKLFSREAIFLGTVSPKLITKAEDIDAYFQGIKTDTPRRITLEDYSTLVLSDTAVLFAGSDTFARTKAWKGNRDACTLHVVDNKG